MESLLCIQLCDREELDALMAGADPGHNVPILLTYRLESTDLVFSKSVQQTCIEYQWCALCEVCPPTTKNPLS